MAADGDELADLLKDMTLFEHGSGNEVIDKHLILKSRGDNKWRACWLPGSHTGYDFDAEGEGAALRRFTKIRQEKVLTLQSYRAIKAIKQRFDRIERAIEQLTQEVRFAPPVHGGSDHHKNQESFERGYASE